MTPALKYTSADLETMPQNGKRYEIIEGELYVSTMPHVFHQVLCTRIGGYLMLWNDPVNAGLVATAPGLVFADDDDVAPDVAWISQGRLATGLEADGHLHVAPELVVEVLSPGSKNELRDRETKLKLYSRRGVQEYWIADWRKRLVEVYRREDLALRQVATLFEGDTLTSPLLPGFACPVAVLFKGIPTEEAE